MYLLKTVAVVTIIWCGCKHDMTWHAKPGDALQTPSSLIYLLINSVTPFEKGKEEENAIIPKWFEIETW